LKFLLDNNLPPALARALHELTISDSNNKHQVTWLKKKFAANTPDTEWITSLSAEGDWVVITHDKFNKGLEREVLRRAGLKVFMLDKSWVNYAFWEKAYQLVRWWPAIVDQSERLKDGAAYQVPWRFSGKGIMKQITL